MVAIGSECIGFHHSPLSTAPFTFEHANVLPPFPPFISIRLNYIKQLNIASQRGIAITA